ncbi:MAG: hypothetical protein ABII21_00180 [bacterium]
MSATYKCDICKKVFKPGEQVTISSWKIEHVPDHICESCWTDPEKWPKIHKVKKKSLY